MENRPPFVSQPIRLAGLLFAGFASLMLICVPFIEDIGEVNPVVFLGSSMAYSLFLACFGVGLGLTATSRVAHWWMLSIAFPLSVVAGFLLWIRWAPETVLRLPAVMWWAIYSLLGTWAGAGCVVAGWGWLRYVRWQPRANSASQIA